MPVPVPVPVPAPVPVPVPVPGFRDGLPAPQYAKVAFCVHSRLEERRKIFFLRERGPQSPSQKKE